MGADSPTTQRLPAPEQAFTVEDRRIVEASGLTTGASAGVLYVNEDAGRPAAVYALDTEGHIRLVVDVPGVVNEDWEDMARGTDEQGRAALFVADTGDAFTVRRDAGEPARTAFSLVRLSEPRVPLGDRVGVLPVTVAAQDVVQYPLRYSDGVARNAEALAVQPGTNRVLLVTKVGGGGRQAHVWVAPEVLDPGLPNDLTRLVPVPVIGASGAAFSAAGDLLAVRNAGTAYVWTVGPDLATSLTQDPVAVPLPEQRQGESVTFTADGRSLLVGSEGRRQPVWSVPLHGDPSTALPDATAQDRLPSEGGARGGFAASAAPWAVAAAGAAAAAAVAFLRLRRRPRAQP